MNFLLPPSFLTWKALPGRSSPPPMPAGSSVTAGGRSTSTQCQKPLGVGAWGSKQGNTKLLVPAGAPDQDNCGDESPNPPTCSCLSGAPSVTSSLVTVNSGTSGRRSYGFGETGRSRLMALCLSLIHISEPTRPY